jgi:nitrite reductase/ring-hydroxylating ferredoxin subunit
VRRRIDICHAEDLAPGQRRVVNISDYDDVLVLNIGGEYYAINNSCPHAGAALERGTVVGGVLFCPLHQWGFYLSTGESSHANDLWAPTYRVVFEGERLYLELD